MPEDIPQGDSAYMALNRLRSLDSIVVAPVSG